MAAIKIPRYDAQCALCRTADANKTGSHLAPNFLIHGAFSFDGKGKRFREIAMRDNLNTQTRPIFYGPEVSPDAIKADLGREMTDEELEENVNSLECDNLFCTRCEDRFGLLETEYAKFYKGEKRTINSKVAYLFWLSVFWRMCVGRMSIFLDGEDEFAMREILDRCITSLPEISQSEADMGDFGYVLWRAKGIRKGFSGIFGTRTEHSPYMIIINDMVVLLISHLSQLDADFEYAGWTIALDSINTYKEEEVVVTEISLEDFARLKRFVIDESFEAGWGPLREKVELDCREHDRSNRQLHSVEKEEELIAAAIEADEEQGRPQKTIRNLYVFQFAALKRRWFARRHKNYNILQDENLLIFPFDIENYKRDLIQWHRENGDVSGMPLVDIYMDKKYWKNKPGFEAAQARLDDMVDNLEEEGYTDTDIMDNLRTKENG